MEIVTLAEFERQTGLHITRKHRGKMSGKHSLSTSVVQNPICQARAQNGDTICAHCYANKMLQGVYKKTEPCFAKNFEVLQRPLKVVPKLPEAWKTFRFEALGDIASQVQFHNYLLIARANPNITFTIWSKNLEICKAVLEYESKPKNLIIIQSAPIVNHAVKPKYDFVDKVFTVYNSWEAAEKAGHPINCEAKEKHLRCEDCNRCYNLNNREVYVNELLR